MKKFVVVSLAALLAVPSGGQVAIAAPVMLAPSLVDRATLSDVVQVQLTRQQAVRQQRVQRQRARAVRQQRRNNAAAIAAGAAAVGIIAGTALAAQRQRGSRVVCDEWGRCYRVARQAPVQYYDDGYYDDYVQPAPRVIYRQPSPIYHHPPVVYRPQPRVIYRQPRVQYQNPNVVYRHHAPGSWQAPAQVWGRGIYHGSPPAAQAPDPTVSRPGISLGN